MTPPRPTEPSSPPRHRRRHRARTLATATVVALVAGPLALVGTAGPAGAAVTVTTEAELRAAWADPATTSIELDADIELTTCTTPTRTSTEPIALDGNGHVIDQGCAPTALDNGGPGAVALHQLTVRGPRAGGGATDADGPALSLHGRADLQAVDVDGAAGAGVAIFGPLRAEDTSIHASGGAGIEAFGNGTGLVPDVACIVCTIGENGGAGIDTTAFVGATVDLTDASIEDNGSSGVEAAGTVLVERSLLADNGGDGIVSTFEVRVANSTATYNAAFGFRVAEPPPVALTGAPTPRVDAERLLLFHTTVAGNGAGNVAGPDITTFGSVLTSTTGDACSGPVTSNGWNFADDDTCGLDGEGDLEDPPVTADLEDLADNGGPTRTRLPAADSVLRGAIPNAACIAAGGVAGLDQRGEPRPAVPGEPCDIGAVQTGPATPPCTADFADVGPTHPFCDEIGWMADEGFAHGWPDGTYRPGVPTSRQALAAFLWRLGGEQAPPPGHPTFSDVPADHRFHDAIAWLAATGIADGYDDGTFRPADPVSRQAAAALLHRAIEEPRRLDGRAATFPDVPEDHTFHDEIEWLVDRGVAEGYDDGTFRPDQPTSRQAMAAFLHRLVGIRT